MNAENSFTLQEGLEQFYKTYQSQLSHKKASLPSEVQAFFKSHDIAHVLFGCDISLYGEGAVKIWTLFGTNLGFWEHLKAYKRANAFELSQNFGFVQVASNLFKLLLSVPTLIYRARKMHQPWPWSENESYLDTPISEIRKEFNIRLV